MATKTLSQDKVKEYERIMAERQGAPRTALTGVADPFADTSVSDFLHEAHILEKMGAAWKMQFCQATMGFGRRSGGLWFAYGADRAPRALLHVEKFVGQFPDDGVTFWAEHIETGRELAKRYSLRFVVIAAFDDGRYSIDLPDAMPLKQYIGERLQKTPEFSGVTNMVCEIPVTAFKKISGEKSETR